MTHAHDDALLLLAYGDLDGAERDAVTRHVAECADCRARFGALERARAAVDWSLADEPRRSRRRTAAIVGMMSLAAALAAFFFTARPSQAPPLALLVPRYASPGLAPIDSMLTRLEQEPTHAIP
jgi:hypothetical protein